VVWPARLHHDLARLHQLGDVGGALGGVGLDVHADYEPALAKADADTVDCIQLVTVWHDKSQLEARYGPKASTILNNHRAKLFLSGLAVVDRNRSMGSDGRHSLNESAQYRPLLPVEDLRRLRPGEGVLLYGHLRPTPVRLRPFYEPREQARRDRAEQRASRRVARTERRLGRKTERAFKRIQRRQDREQHHKAAARVVWLEREGGRR
jgi:type IV secretory pathway TraG/TraD family ATPase VirD4